MITMDENALKKLEMAEASVNAAAMRYQEVKHLKKYSQEVQGSLTQFIIAYAVMNSAKRELGMPVEDLFGPRRAG